MKQSRILNRVQEDGSWTKVDSDAPPLFIPFLAAAAPSSTPMIYSYPTISEYPKLGPLNVSALLATKLTSVLFRAPGMPYLFSLFGLFLHVTKRLPMDYPSELVFFRKSFRFSLPVDSYVLIGIKTSKRAATLDWNSDGVIMSRSDSVIMGLSRAEGGCIGEPPYFCDTAERMLIRADMQYALSHVPPLPFFP